MLSTHAEDLTRRPERPGRMRATRVARSALALSLVASAAACGKSAPPPPPAAGPASEAAAVPPPAALMDATKAKALFGTPPASYLPADVPPARVVLGQTLYHDPRLSRDGDVACASCHVLERYGVDGEPTSKGHKGQRGGRNAPTVFFAAGHTAQFWDGRAADVEEQAKGPVLNPIEMAMPDQASVEARLQAIPGYVQLFKAAFPNDGDTGVTFGNMALAIGAFERTLAPRSRFDEWLDGDAKALLPDEQEGLQAFVDTGCAACHGGPLLGGRSFHKLGQAKPWPWAERGEDPGRKEITGKDSDLHVFKAPSLRNVAMTGPYFHDGKTTDLADAVRLMAWHQLDKRLDDAKVSKIVSFLGSLTSTLPGAMVRQPERPADGPQMPTIAPEGAAAPPAVVVPPGGAPQRPIPAPAAAEAPGPAPTARTGAVAPPPEAASGGGAVPAALPHGAPPAAAPAPPPTTAAPKEQAPAGVR